MDKQEFINRYNISDTAVTTPALQVLSIPSLCETLEEFLTGNFGGAVTVECEAMPNEFVLLSIEYLAIFLRRLFCDIHGRTLLQINFQSFKGHISITVSADSPIHLGNTEISQLIKLGQNAGMNTCYEDCKITLTAEYTDADLRSIYARMPDRAKAFILSRLFWVFFNNQQDTFQ